MFQALIGIFVGLLTGSVEPNSFMAQLRELIINFLTVS